MLLRPHELFERARKGEYAVGAFAAPNLEIAQAVVAAAQDQAAAVILQVSPRAIAASGLKLLTSIVRSVAEEAEYPAVLHLDHGQDLALIKTSIEAGCTSVMIDASGKAFAENVRAAREVVAYAHDRGVWVEAAVGSDLSPTTPAEAKQFVEATGIDALAVSVGTIHGAFTGQEYIRFELLEAIEQNLPLTPLVLHGASGVSAAHLREVARSNVCKVNVGTELLTTYAQALHTYLAQEAGDPHDMLPAAREAVRSVVAEKIQLLGGRDQGTL